MPMFEYACVPCGFRFEKLQRAGSTDTITCPACGSSEVKKQFSTFSTPSGGSAGSCSPAPGGG